MSDIQKYLEQPDLFVTPMVTIPLRLYGMECLEWDPIVTTSSIEDSLNVKLTKKQKDKVNCGLALIASDAYTKSLEVFATSNAVMGNEPIQSGMMVLNDVDDMCWGVVEYSQLMGDDIVDIDFGTDICYYVGEVLTQAGITEVMDCVPFAKFNDQIMQNIKENLLDPSMYLNRMTRTKDAIQQMLNARKDIMVSQLQALDLILPVKTA